MAHREDRPALEVLELDHVVLRVRDQETSQRFYTTILGLTLDQYMRLQAAEPADKKKPKAEACIHIFLPGGQAHQESWDPKPFAPVEYRGQMGTVKTKIEGEVFNECLVKTAAIADQITVCRAMTHGEAAHERGTHNMFTGYRPSPALKFPSIGSVVSHELGVRNNLPPYVAVPSMPAQDAGSGYLSSAYAPFSLGSDPANGGFRVQDLSLPGNVTPDRFTTRKNMLDAVNAQGGVNGAAIELLSLDDATQPAATLELTQKLLDDHGVAALFGYAFVPGLVRALPLLDERRVPLLGVYNGADNLRKDPHPWLFTTTASLRDEVSAATRDGVFVS